MTKRKHNDNDTVRQSPQSPTNKTTRTAWIALAILSFTQIITMYSETMLLPAIPDIITDFDISYNNASWLLTTYLIAGAVAAPISIYLIITHPGF
jgi:predicted MFS family arabinose efflux permease